MFENNIAAHVVFSILHKNEKLNLFLIVKHEMYGRLLTCMGFVETPVKIDKYDIEKMNELSEQINYLDRTKNVANELQIISSIFEWCETRSVERIRIVHFLFYFKLRDLLTYVEKVYLNGYDTHPPEDKQLIDSLRSTWTILKMQYEMEIQ